MGGNHSRSKGGAGERELTKLLPGAKKISRMYAPGPDIIWRGRYIEAKRRASWPSKVMEKWRRDAQIVMFRVDREPDWMVYLPLSVLLDMLEEQ